MKKLLTLVVVAVMTVCLFVGCAQPAENSAPVSEAPVGSGASASDTPTKPSAPAEKTTYRYIFIPKLVHSWYDAVQEGIATAEAELEQELNVDIEVEWLAPSVADGVEQADLLESAISKKPDGIALSVVDQDMVSSIIDQSLENGIPLITFDTDGASTNRLAFVGLSSEGNMSEGASAAKWMAERIGGEGQIAILAGTPTAQNHKEKTQGFVDELEANWPNIEIVTTQYDNDDLETATQLSESILAQYPDLDGIWGCNGINGIGAGYAFKSAVEAGKFDIGDVVIYGYDTEPEMIQLVEDGYVTAFATQNVSDHGYYALKYLLDISLGNEIPEAHEVPLQIYTKETMSEAPGVG